MGNYHFSFLKIFVNHGFRDFLVSKQLEIMQKVQNNTENLPPAAFLAYFGI